jgi:hypothetical protein
VLLHAAAWEVAHFTLLCHPTQCCYCAAARCCFRKWRSSFFNWFYFVINIGSLVASTVVVGVQESKGYGIGFGIPTIFFAVVRQMHTLLQ